jgi:hypothetical protein
MRRLNVLQFNIHGQNFNKIKEFYEKTIEQSIQLFLNRDLL